MYRVNGRVIGSGAIGKREREVEEVEEELMANANLLKVGCEPSDGSDS
jgi:hypothetical protein